MVELESAGEMTRSEVAAFLREFADELNDRPTREEYDDDTARATGDREGVTAERQTEGTSNDTRTQESAPIESARERKRITLIVGGNSATVTVPHTMNFDVEVESRSPMFSSGVKQGIDFELAWEIEDPDQLDDDGIEVE
ncbi:hypothetical protein BRC73_06155 [Halobacteriales archaeon QH_7_66_37]|nr:MAG: hypothetical protein BRC73_06155 [Halobacteriales archaeon QH_7_66_37]